MGTWGSAIFSDDVACDVRVSYRELLEDGIESSKATHLLLEQFADLLDDQDDSPVFWLALAATQWKLGRLEDEVKKRAIEVIDVGLGLDRWEEAGPSALEARKKALSKLRDQLTSPQPMPKKVRKPWRYQTEMSIGDAISYRLDSGKFVILRVIGIETNRYYSAPTLELCDWIGETLPPAKSIQQLPFIISEGVDIGTCEVTVSPHKKGAYPTDRIEVIARGLQVRHVTDCNSFASWVFMDLWINRIADRLNTKQPTSDSPLYRLLKTQ